LELNNVNTDTATKHFGTVKFFGIDGKAFGFITPDDPKAHGGKEMFVHISAVGAAGLRGLEAGDRVEYTVEIDERSKRPCAANLRLV
jgi:CspA family cold shock protein